MEHSIKRITIAVDLDGVLVEHVVPLLQRLNRTMNLCLQKHDITTWDYPIGDTNVEIEMKKAGRDKQFVRQLPPIKGAVTAMQTLSQKFDIIIATGRKVTPDSWSIDWLRKHNIPYKKFINTSSRGKILPDVKFLIDDEIRSIEEFIRNASLCKQAILFAQPWNQDTRKISDLIALKKVRTANDWQDVLALLFS